MDLLDFMRVYLISWQNVEGNFDLDSISADVDFSEIIRISFDLLSFYFYIYILGVVLSILMLLCECLSRRFS